MDHSEAESRRDERVEFPCGNCGARLKWDPDADALTCDYCGHATPVAEENRVIEEHPLEDAGAAARGWGLEVRGARCGNCGATVVFERTETSRECVFCGSAHVLAQEANRNAIRPESLVPMDVSRAQVERAFLRWIDGLWFRPNALKKTRAFDARGVYVPHWTFDCHVDSSWTAESGTYYYVTVTKTRFVNGKHETYTEQERRTRWWPSSGDRSDDYDDLLVNASRAVPEDLASRLGGFRRSGLVPYRPEYLAGWLAEEYSVDLRTGWGRARVRVVAEQQSRCARDVPGDTHRSLRVENHIRDVRWKHVLLPLWTLTYEFRGKTYPILVHGQTGRVAGRAPYSWVKITLFVLLVAALAAGAYLLYRMTR